MSLIEIESVMTVKIPAVIHVPDLWDNNINENFFQHDGCTYIKFNNADLKEVHLRTIKNLINNLCNKYPKSKVYKKLQSDVCQLVHNCN